VLLVLRGYKLLMSPLFAGSCRFTPSCADYTAEAVRLHGAFGGLVLGVRRLARCRPWGGHGFDPVPARTPAGRRAALAAHDIETARASAVKVQ
jgi:putative membrane protein insertion efficiency factor